MAEPIKQEVLDARQHRTERALNVMKDYFEKQGFVPDEEALQNVSDLVTNIINDPVYEAQEKNASHLYGQFIGWKDYLDDKYPGTDIKNMTPEERNAVAVNRIMANNEIRASNQYVEDACTVNQCEGIYKDAVKEAIISTSPAMDRVHARFIQELNKIDKNKEEPAVDEETGKPLYIAENNPKTTLGELSSPLKQFSQGAGNSLV